MTLIGKDNNSQLKVKLKQNDNLMSILRAEDLLVEWSLKTGKSYDSINRSNHVNISSSAHCPGCHDRVNMVGIPQKHIARSSLGEKIAELKFYAGLVAPSLDTNTLRRILSDLGLDAKTVAKKIDGKIFIVFSDVTGNRNVLKNTKYLVSDPKIIDLAIGRVGVNRAIIGGARLTFALYVPINILTTILDDKATLSTFIGTTATDLVKIGISSLIAAAVANGIAGMATAAAGPFAIAIVVGVLTAYKLDQLDSQIGITEKLIAKLDEITNKTIGEFARKWWEVDAFLRWQAIKGHNIGEGVFY